MDEQGAQIESPPDELARLRARITELEAAEVRRKETEEQFRAFVETTNEWIWAIDLEARHTYSNPALEIILGYSPREFMAGSSLKYLHEEDRRKVGAMLRGKIARKEGWTGLVLRWRHRDGGYRYLESTAVPILDERGNLRGFQGADRDISERRRAEEALRESESRFRSLVETTSDWIWEVDAHAVYTYCSPKIFDLLGYEPDEIIGKKPFDLMPPEEARRMAPQIAQLMAAARPFDGLENVNLRKDGRLVHLETSGVPTLDSQGLLTGYRGIDRDITERKRTEEDRRQLEAQMQHAQKLESLGILAGGIAHDFNNMLTAILGHANLAMLELPPESGVRPSIEAIEESSLRAADLCRQLLAYAGMGRFVVEPINLSLLVQELTHLLQVSVSKKAMLRCNFGTDVPAIDADPAQVRQVIMNLVINASEAIGDKEGVVAVTTGVMQCDEAYLRESRTARIPAPGAYVFAEVADTGCGMAADTLAKIFDPFFTSKFTGCGLGLAAVQGIVQSHNGAIMVQSEAGKGTCFRVLFPASRAEAVSPPEKAPVLYPGTGLILLVDDEEPVRKVTGMLLERCGFRVLTAANGREAIGIFRERAAEIACVLLDLTMPQMDGAETCRELRRIREDVRVILASGYSGQELSRRFHDLGLAGFIAKPFEASTLSAMLRDILNRVDAGPES